MCLAMFMAVILISLVASLILEWPHYEPLLQRTSGTPGKISASECVYACWLICFKSAALLMPFWIIAVLLRRRRRVAWTWMTATSMLLLGWLLSDLIVFESFGRHLTHFATYLKHEGALQWAGGIGRWFEVLGPRLLMLLSFILIGCAISNWFVRRLPERLVNRLSSPLPLIFATLLIVAAFVLPITMRRATGHTQLCANIITTVPVFVDLIENDDRLDDVERAIGKLVQKEFNSLVDRLKDPHGTDPDAKYTGTRKPNVIIIVAETLRGPMVQTGMPKLVEWSKDGLSFLNHHSSNNTENGVYGSLFGRSPLTMYGVLQKTPVPQSVICFRNAGYRTICVSAVPGGSDHMGPFMNASTFDVYKEFEYADDDWPRQDRHAVDQLKLIMEKPSDRPYLAVLYLMSTHWPFKYPDEYESLDLSDRAKKMFVDRDVPSTVKAQYERMKYKYLRSLAFMDDLLYGLIESFDGDNHTFVVTGDHGVSFYDDGTFTHATRLSDAQTLVPLFMAGGGIAPRVIETKTSHSDLLPTLLHALSGKPHEISHTDGRDMLDKSTSTRGTIVAEMDEYGRGTLHVIRDGKRMGFEVYLEGHKRYPGVFIRSIGFLTPNAARDPDHGVSTSDVQAWADYVNEQTRRLAGKNTRK